MQILMDQKVAGLLTGEVKVLEITTHHDAWAGTLDCSEWDRYCIPFENLKADGEYGCADYRFRVLDCDEACVTVSWQGTTLVSRLGEKAVQKTISEQRSYMSRYDTTLYFQLCYIGPQKRLEELVWNIAWMYENEPSKVKKGATAEDEQLAIAVIDAHLAQGEVEYYPMKALLSSVDDWGRCFILRRKLFRDIMKEGYAKDCLCGDPPLALKWLRKAHVCNDFDRIFDSEPYRSYFRRR